jgi:hypothetical protein
MEYQSKDIGELADALNRTQQESLFALTDNENPFFKSKYADLSSVWSVAREPLTKNGLSVAQTMRVGERDNPIIVTTLLHRSGQWIRGELEMPAPKKDPQQFGSAVTYGRRYALAAILGICPADDDAQAATESMGKTKTVANKPAQKPAKIRTNSEKVEKPAKKDGVCTKPQYGKICVMAKNHWPDDTKEFVDASIKSLCEWFRSGEKLSKAEASQIIDTFHILVPTAKTWKDLGPQEAWAMSKKLIDFYKDGDKGKEVTETEMLAVARNWDDFVMQYEAESRMADADFQK